MHTCVIKENHTMIKLGVNSVLFKKYDFATAAKAIKTAGPMCAVGFMIALVLIIISRRKETKLG